MNGHADICDPMESKSKACLQTCVDDVSMCPQPLQPHCYDSAVAGTTCALSLYQCIFWVHLQPYGMHACTRVCNLCGRKDGTALSHVCTGKSQSLP